MDFIWIPIWTNVSLNSMRLSGQSEIWILGICLYYKESCQNFNYYNGIVVIVFK